MDYKEFSKEEINLQEKSLGELEFQTLLDFIARGCYSEPGKDLIRNSRPNQDLYWLNKELNLIEEIIKILTEDEKLPFENYSDIKDILHKAKIENSVLSTTELLSVAETIRNGRLIKSYFEAREDKYLELNEEIELIHTNRLLEKHINEAIDDTGEVRDTASKELSRIRKDIHSKSNYLRHRLTKILQTVSEQDMTQEDFISLREGRFVIPIKSEHKRHIPGIIHGLSQTGATVFLEPSEIIEINNELSLLHNEEKREIYRILSNLSSEIGTEANEFLRSFEVIVHMDSLLAKANYSLKYGGIKPEISEGDILLNKVKHPLLVHTKGIKKVIPLTVEFNENRVGHLISGPNAGGKTVALKSIGINLAMALSGLYPLGECKTDFRMIYTSIGDNQSIEQDLSTFSSQVMNIKNILSVADKNSVVLIDEIGSGTDPHEGSALSAGILDTLLEYKSYFVATTHNTFLKSYALNRKVIKNDSLEFDNDKLIPTYKFLEGIPGNSYAFQLAKNLGLPNLVLKRAKEFLGDKQGDLEDSIQLVHDLKVEAQKIKIKTEKEKQKIEKLKEKLEKKLEKLNTNREAMVKEAFEEAEKIVKNANALVENTIREIKEQKKQTKDIKENFIREKKRIENQSAQFSKPKKAKRKEQIVINDGDTVKSEESTSTGIVIKVFNDKTALVDFNGIKFKLPVDTLTIVAQKPSQTKSDTNYISFDVKTSVDVRGMRAHEAIPEVEHFIDESMLTNLNTLTIVHGKGTGALRHAIHEYLENHHAIKSFRIGTMTEGGDGATIVEF